MDAIVEKIKKLTLAAAEDNAKRTNLLEAIEAAKGAPTPELQKLVADATWLDDALRKELGEALQPQQQQQPGVVAAVKNLGKKEGWSPAMIAGAVGVFLLLVFLGAGLPLLLNALKSRKDERVAKESVSDAMSSQLKPSDNGVENKARLQGSSIELDENVAARTNSVVTYTIALRIGTSGDIDNTRELVVMQRNEKNSIVSSFTLFADPQLRQLKVFLKKAAGGYCTFAAEDLPLYRWCVVHVVFNNTETYRSTHIFIDGKLLKVGRHDTCEGGVANQSGNTIKFGSNNMLEVQYFKAVPRTLMQDEIKKEAASITADINGFYMDQLMLSMQCAL